MIELEGYQRVYLRGQAHGLEPVVRVGEKGLTDAVLKALDEALLAHELIKVKMHQPPNKKALAHELADKSGAVLCGLVGHIAILYKRHPKKPRIHVPVRPPKDE